MAAQAWTLSRLINKVQDDLDLHSEDFVTPNDLKQFVWDAIDDAEEIVIDLFSDFLKTYADLEVEAGQTAVDLPEDIYESRMRGLFYSEQGFGQPNASAYKLRKTPMGTAGLQSAYEPYTYDLINSTADGQQLYISPAIREDSDDKFRLWYIRQFKRPTAMSDVLDKGLRVQYILSHVKRSVMEKEGNALLDIEAGKLLKQEEKLRKSLSRLTDDDENVILEPDDYALSEAYGDDY